MDDECLHVCTRRRYMKPFAFNAAYTLIVVLCGFWFGSLFALHWGVKLAVQLDLYVSVVACILSVAGIILVVTVPNSDTPYTLLTDPA